MTTPNIKAAYSLDDETARALARLARRWNVSESEALRRAICAAAGPEPKSPSERMAALKKLQDSLKERGVDFDQWQREAWAIRHGVDP